MAEKIVSLFLHFNMYSNILHCYFFSVQKSSIHPFSIPAYPVLGRRGLLEPIPAITGREAGSEPITGLVQKI